MTPFREAGLPMQSFDLGGEQARFGLAKGVVRAVYPDLHRVDIEPEIGGRIAKALVVGDVFPEIHVDTDNPQHALFGFIDGNVADPFCFLIPFRRLSGPNNPDDGKERRYYHKNQQIVRVKDITIRITPDNKAYIYESEKDDYLMYDMNTRTAHMMTPHIRLGTDEMTRMQYDENDVMKLVMPKILLGQQGLEDTDGMTYRAGDIIHLVSQVIKLTATQAITLDPPRINFGNASASEQVILGNLFQTFLNAFLSLFNGHVHTGVQTGGGVSGPPATPTGLMPNSTLSTIARVSQ